MADRPPQPANDDDTKAQQRRRLVWTLVGAGVLLLGLLLACVLLFPKWLYPDLTDNDLKDVKAAQNESDASKKQELKDARLKLQNDARTTLLQGLGALLVLTGAGIGATVTLRQVRATRDQIRETATASRNQLKLSEQGLVTDRYTRAVEQLGHEKAPVRLGALYSLEHLAQDNPEYRQTVVDVVCAYLRMPYIPPARSDLDATHVGQAVSPAEDGIPAAHPVPGQSPAQEELQVRQTAQHRLADHLRCHPGTSGQDAELHEPSQQNFWPGISLDLTGAILIDFNFAQVSVIQAWFDGATFRGDARFNNATFKDDTRFNAVTFQGRAEFGEATFQGGARFDEAAFQRGAWFTEAAFQGYAWFSKAIFQRGAEFGEATFQGDARFNKATFQNITGFNKATFHGYAWFYKATFESVTTFSDTTFQGDARFNEATFTSVNGVEGVAGAQVLHLDDPDLNKRRVWPDGFTVRPDPADPTRGTLVRAEPTEEPEPAVPPSDETGR
jgi:uncharacterized protein YjbI with pentapeptide repeats